MIGADVAGVSTAYHLSKKGYQVLILHAGHGPATGASAIAAGGMARSNSFVTKASWITTIESLFGISNEAGFLLEERRQQFNRLNQRDYLGRDDVFKSLWSSSSCCFYGRS